MPTPFYHLSLAQDLLASPSLSAAARRLCGSQPAAYYLGHTAPDVQTISGQARTATHFFDLPLDRQARPPWEELLARYPHLCPAWRLPAEQGAFVAGYLCHLQADWLWIDAIFAPVFGPQAGWDTFAQRLYIHNVLRTHLDQQILAGLPAGIGAALAGARPAAWLPFIQDADLSAWRDMLADQLRPGATIRTVEVFAARQGISPQEFQSLLDSPQSLAEQVYSHLPDHRLETYRRRVIKAGVRLLNQVALGYTPFSSSIAVGRPTP